jgi:hypothetical protein
LRLRTSSATCSANPCWSAICPDLLAEAEAAGFLANSTESPSACGRRAGRMRAARLANNLPSLILEYDFPPTRCLRPCAKIRDLYRRARKACRRALELPLTAASFLTAPSNWQRPDLLSRFPERATEADAVH